MIIPENKEKYLIKTFDFDNYDNVRINVYVTMEEKIIFELIAKIKLEGHIGWRVLATKEHYTSNNNETVNSIFEEFLKIYKEKIEFLELIVNFFDNIDSIKLE